MKLGRNGWMSGVCHIASPNHDARPHGMPVDMLVIHNISLPPNEYGGRAIEQFFTNTLDTSSHPYFEQLKGVRVSAHFLVRRNGRIVQFVSCSRRAWHAGVSNWQGRTRCNDFSIGIELEGSDFEPFHAEQYRSLVKLTRRLMRVYPIQNLVGHSDIAPERKTDPGPFFDWKEYFRLLGSPMSR